MYYYIRAEYSRCSQHAAVMAGRGSLSPAAVPGPVLPTSPACPTSPVYSGHSCFTAVSHPPVSPNYPISPRCTMDTYGTLTNPFYTTVPQYTANTMGSQQNRLPLTPLNFHEANGYIGRSPELAHARVPLPQ